MNDRKRFFYHYMHLVLYQKVMLFLHQFLLKFQNFLIVIINISSKCGFQSPIGEINQIYYRLKMHILHQHGFHYRVQSSYLYFTKNEHLLNHMLSKHSLHLLNNLELRNETVIVQLYPKAVIDSFFHLAIYFWLKNLFLPQAKQKGQYIRRFIKFVMNVFLNGTRFTYRLVSKENYLNFCFPAHCAYRVIHFFFFNFYNFIEQLNQIQKMRSNSKKSLVKSYTNKKSNIQRSSSTEFLQARSKSKTKKTMSKNMSKTMQSTHDSKKNLLSSFKKTKEMPSNAIKKKSSANKKKSTTKSKNIGLKSSKTMIVTSYLNEEQKQNFLYEKTKDQYFTKQLKDNYFVYGNILIPIENSQQRKFVFKIKLIDRHNQQIAGNITQQKKLPRKIDEATITEIQHEDVVKHDEKKQKKSVSIMTIIPTLQISEIQTSITHIQNVEIQTQVTSNRSSKSINIQHLIQQKSEKCFNNTLTDLQFLYLPDNRNFQNFSNLQCKHYQDLFISLARKFETIKKQKQSIFQCENGEQFLQQVYSQQDIAQNIAIVLCQRQFIQIGLIQTHFEQGFPTHINTMISYLSNLFLVAQMKEKNNIVLKMNSLYSFSYRQRFVRVYRGLPRRKNIPVLSDELFHALEKQIFNSHQFPSQDIQNAVHYNNRMYFDATNEFLQQYRPFYESGGQPFPWSQKIKASFYTIDQDSIKLLFCQVIEKLQECALMLCGIIIDYDLLLANIQKKQPEKRIKQTQKSQKHEVHLQKMNIQQTKMIHYQMKRLNEEPEMEEQKLILMVSLSQEVLKQIFLQEMLIFQQIFSNEQKQ